MRKRLQCQHYKNRLHMMVAQIVSDLLGQVLVLKPEMHRGNKCISVVIPES